MRSGLSTEQDPYNKLEYKTYIRIIFLKEQELISNNRNKRYIITNTLKERNKS